LIGVLKTLEAAHAKYEHLQNENRAAGHEITCDVILRALHGYGTVKQRDKPTKTK
jgi:hypothetical protein